jgi:hypothetical protein
MAAFTKVNSLTEALAEKVHNLGADSLVVFMCAAASAPLVTYTQLSQVTQISYTNLSSRAITTSSSSQSSGVYKLILTDWVGTASGGPVAGFRYPGIYNDTATNDEILGFYDYGSDLVLASGETFTMDFDGSNGALSLT